MFNSRLFTNAKSLTSANMKAVKRSFQNLKCFAIISQRIEPNVDNCEPQNRSQLQQRTGNLDRIATDYIFTYL